MDIVFFNNILDTGSISNGWEAGKRVPIYKKRDTSEQSNYGAITITSRLGKLFTHLLKGPYPGKWHVFVLALLYLFECLNE